MEEKKKSKAPLIIILVLVFLIAVAGSSFGGYLFGKTDGEKVGNKGNEKNISRNVSKSELGSILYRMDILTQSLYQEFPIENVSNISNQGLLKISLGFISKSDSGTNVENYIKQIVGTNANIKLEDYICTIDNKPLYVYNNGWYRNSNESHGHGASSRYTKIYFKSATLENDTLKIETNVIYGENRELGGPGDTFYDGVKDDSKKLFSAMYEDLDTKYEEIKDTLPVTTYTFKKTDFDGYNLESVIIK